MILSFLEFLHSCSQAYVHTHCYSHMYKHQKLGKRQRHRKWDSWGFAVWCYVEQFNEIIITYPRMFVDLQREMSNRKSSVWKIGTIFPLYSFKMSQHESFILIAESLMRHLELPANLLMELFDTLYWYIVSQNLILTKKLFRLIANCDFL